MFIQIIEVHKRTYSQMSNFITWMDAAMPADKFKETLKRIYKGRTISDNTEFVVILCKVIPGFNPERPQNYPVLRFSQNWNNKLDNDCFTTIRPFDPSKYLPNTIYRIDKQYESNESSLFKTN